MGISKLWLLQNWVIILPKTLVSRHLIHLCISTYLVFLALIFLGAGWFQSVPIDPEAIRGRHRLLKLFIAYATEALVSIFLAVISLYSSVYFFGESLTQWLLFKLFSYFGRPFMIFLLDLAHLNIADVFPDLSTCAYRYRRFH